MVKKIQFVTCMHGNERIPALALASKNIQQLMANPGAVMQNKRFVDQDLNGAFGKPVTDLETARAEYLLSLIDPATVVVDFHTYEADSGPFVILVDPAMLLLALQTGITRIVYMKYSVKKGGALINFRSGISVEVGNHNDPKGFDIAIHVAERIRDEAVPLAQDEVELFEVYDEITEPGEYVDFVQHEQGFYPVFAKKNTYKNFGLKAKLVSSFS